MKTFLEPGHCVTLTAPTGGVVSGSAYKIGTLVVVATASVAQTLKFEGAAVGVFTLPKPNDEAWTEGVKLYFDAATGEFTTDSATGANQLVGVAAAAAAEEATTGLVRLDGATR